MEAVSLRYFELSLPSHLLEEKLVLYFVKWTTSYHLDNSACGKDLRGANMNIGECNVVE